MVGWLTSASDRSWFTHRSPRAQGLDHQDAGGMGHRLEDSGPFFCLCGIHAHKHIAIWLYVKSAGKED